MKESEKSPKLKELEKRLLDLQAEMLSGKLSGIEMRRSKITALELQKEVGKLSGRKKGKYG
jgi:hypothetical protein